MNTYTMPTKAAPETTSQMFSSRPLKRPHFVDQGGRRYQVYRDLPEHLARRLEDAANNEHLKSWADTVLALPLETSYIPKPSQEFIKAARSIWNKNVCGNQQILNVLLRHAVEYCITGRTSAVLLSGPPGIGKTHVARTYAQILDLPYQFIFAPSAATTRGLAGAPNLFVGGGVGAIVQAMLTTDTGNPLICIDEIDKVSAGFHNMPSFNHELLGALDDSRECWHDNYLEMDVDISHIPFVFTANDLGNISKPLLDRMEIIEMEPPTQTMLYDIINWYTLPNVLRTYGSDWLQIRDGAIHTLVEQLWNAGHRSCRPYQKAVELLISNAYLTMLESGASVTVTEDDVKKVSQSAARRNGVSPIGFLSA